MKRRALLAALAAVPLAPLLPGVSTAPPAPAPQPLDAPPRGPLIFDSRGNAPGWIKTAAGYIPVWS